jgi:hypothetical protein
VFKLPVSSPLVELAQQVPPSSGQSLVDQRSVPPVPAVPAEPVPGRGGAGAGGSSSSAPLSWVPQSVPVPVPQGSAAASDGVVARGRAAVERAFDEFAAATPAAGAAPRSLSDLPQINREDYREDPRGTLELFGGVRDLFDPPGFTEEASARYVNDRLTRIDQMAGLAGMPAEARAAMVEELRFRIQNDPEAKNPEQMMNLADELLAAEEANLVPVAAQGTAGSEAGAPAEQLSPAGFSPQDIAVLQSTIGQFMQPYTDQMAESGAAQAALMNSYADSAVTPGIAALARQQASSMQAGGDRLAAAYMAQAQAFPTIRAYDEVAQLRQQIAGMQAQMAQQQFAGGGVGDFEAILQGLGAGG